MAQSRSIVRPYGDPAIGTSPTDTRLAHAVAFAQAAIEAWGARPGVLWGGAVTGTAGWAYAVAPAALVMTRGALQGAYPAAITGVQNVPTDPAPASGSRIDIVYALQQDPDLGDLGNAPVLGVAKGVASGSPAAPALPTGAMELGRATITSLMTQTLDATVASTAPITTVHGGRYRVPAASALSRIVGALPGDMAVTNSGVEYEYLGTTWERVWRSANVPGATVFDTDWVNMSLASGWSATPGYTPQIRRIGYDVAFRGRVQTTSGSNVSGSVSPCFIPSSTFARLGDGSQIRDAVGFIAGQPYRQMVGGETTDTGAFQTQSMPSTNVIHLSTMRYRI